MPPDGTTLTADWFHQLLLQHEPCDWLLERDCFGTDPALHCPEADRLLYSAQLFMQDVSHVFYILQYNWALFDSVTLFAWSNISKNANIKHLSQPQNHQLLQLLRSVIPAQRHCNYPYRVPHYQRKMFFWMLLLAGELHRHVPKKWRRIDCKCQWK